MIFLSFHLENMMYIIVENIIPLLSKEGNILQERTWRAPFLEEIQAQYYHKASIHYPIMLNNRSNTYINHLSLNIHPSTFVAQRIMEYYYKLLARAKRN